jgi:hypothetical protein
MTVDESEHIMSSKCCNGSIPSRLLARTLPSGLLCVVLFFLASHLTEEEEEGVEERWRRRSFYTTWVGTDERKLL